MWPWGHVAFAYVCYSLGSRALVREPPAGREALVVAVAALGPDLLDKPLSWGLGVFPTGNALGHSAFVALPAGLAVLALGQRYGRRREAAAAVVGYWTHLVGDVGFGALVSGDLDLGAVLWPLVAREPYATDEGLVGRTLRYLREFAADAADGEFAAGVLLVAYVAPSAVALALWLLDGRPGPGTLRRLVARLRRTAAGTA
ncbi:metal-dependent hydrolase [Halosegnis marinus]|uniref:Metal-dependent hydrolase n=1 Tax=Halosegnis marinus TaxID=3034023 RepID=A0ABD5ZRJ2_9EURY|nr:metal-dependent hydrolase [Halosegnis sp. DT85]